MNHRAEETDELQLDITEDGFMSLMTDNGDTKDDVKVPDNEVGEKINQMYTVEEKDCSKSQNSRFAFKGSY